jgi:hypothetical protein
MIQAKTMLNLLGDPSRWTQGELARDENGRKVHPDDCRAVCWCLSGAHQKVYGFSGKGLNAVLIHIETHFGQTIPVWNDDIKRTYEDVIKFLRELGI